jgi:hypothetical protein
LLLLTALVGAAMTPRSAQAIRRESFVSDAPAPHAFPLIESGQPAPLLVASDDFPGVLRVARHLQDDLRQVAGTEPKLLLDGPASAERVVIVGTLGKSALIEELARVGKIDATVLAGRREKFLIQAVDSPLPGVSQALVVAGSDKRGAIYGMFELSAQSGVSPWAWWADAPVKRRQNLYVAPGRHTRGEPKVRYRGIFINDEAPALAGWMQEKFGGCNSKFYAHVFELILRLNGNFLWPAMWGRSIYEDDPESSRLADEYGVVLSTSHHEPMMRAHVDWERLGPAKGPWNYEKNGQRLREFWGEGIRRTNGFERVVTVGMRGDGDMPMSEESNIELLERIVADQRKIIAAETGAAPEKTPQVWALYKEVQDYYDRGMRVPDDVTLFLCDDNWGNIRKLPKLDEPLHPGGYGIYYHFDYVGGPRNYKWLNTNPLPRVWEQMHLAYQYEARRIWLVNVGDVKPMELPIEFFLDFAWNPEEWQADELDDYQRLWAERQFGPEHAEEIGELLAKYAKFNSRRKPELLSSDTYSLVNFDEAERVVDQYQSLARRAEAIRDRLPAEAHDAYFQLVLYPVQACANLNALYLAAAKNRLYARQGRSDANRCAELVDELFARDAELARQYNEDLADGKWRHMMDQTHIGYDNWQEPPKNAPPATERIDLPAGGSLGAALEGSETAILPGHGDEAELPALDPRNHRRRWIEAFNAGSEPVEFTVSAGEAWLSFEPSRGTVGPTQRIEATVDWTRAPRGVHRVPITLSAAGGEIRVLAVVDNSLPEEAVDFGGFVETGGFVSIEAEHAARRIDGPTVRWETLPDFGRTLSGVTIMPTNSPQSSPGGEAPRLEYDVYLPKGGAATVHVYAAPTQDFTFSGGLEYAVSFDDQPPRRVNINADTSVAGWERDVANCISMTTSEHQVAEAGAHVLKLWMVDPGVVLEKIVVSRGQLPSSYLGPPESTRGRASASLQSESNVSSAGKIAVLPPNHP